MSLQRVKQDKNSAVSENAGGHGHCHGDVDEFKEGNVIVRKMQSQIRKDPLHKIFKKIPKDQNDKHGKMGQYLVNRQNFVQEADS